MFKNFLFVCSVNLQRSKTGEDYFSKIYPELNFKSAVTNIKLCLKAGSTPLTEEMLIWADIVFVMEDKHLQIINQHSDNKYNTKMVLLSIDDSYTYFQEELVSLLIEKTANYF